MNVSEFLDVGSCVRVVQTLMHFLWQGLLIAVLVSGLNVVASRQSARLRYWVAAAAMLAMAACLPANYCMLAPAVRHVAGTPPQIDAIADGNTNPGPLDVDKRIPLDEIPAAASPAVAESAISGAAGEMPRQASAEFWKSVSPYIVGIYLVGVLLMMVRLAIAFGGGERLRRASWPVEDSHVLGQLRDKATELGLRVVPAIACCEHVASPLIVGVLKPTILLPVCLLTELSPSQVEAALAHELAHIRRWDHVANVIQRVIESLLFFHPAVWYVSRCVSREREHCCDDMVVANGTEPRGYAELLVRISE